MVARSPAGGATQSADPRKLTPWHTLSVTEVADKLECELSGLSQDEARKRLERYGENRLPESPPVSPWVILVRQFRSPLIYILIIAAAISLFLGLLDDAVFIVLVLILNAVIGYFQESRAEKDIRSLGRMLISRARVQRNGHFREIDSSELVPGDLVWLESGARVPADIRLVSAHGLRVDQSLLTGESVPVEKTPIEHLEEKLPASDHENMVFSGSTVFQGKGSGIVVGTALSTQVGLIALELGEEAAVKPPLVVRMERFTRVIAVVVLGLCLVVFGIGMAQGASWTEMLMAALALAVSAIPEGLPVALTVALAIGVNRMARRNVLIRRLEAVEALGSCSVIGSDKTGTLTANQLTIVGGRIGEKPFEVTGAGYETHGSISCDGVQLSAEESAGLYRLTRAGILCNDATLVAEDGDFLMAGDPGELALLVLSYKAGQDPGDINRLYPRTNEIPFESERRFSASYHQGQHGRGLTVVKGAPERVLPMCRALLDFEGRKEVPLCPERVQRWVDSLTLQGFRVLAIADQETDEVMPADETPSEPAGITLIGLVGMTDPPRDGVPAAIEACRRAGIRVLMITGDHLRTARAISERIGIETGDDKVIDGSSLDAMDDDELMSRIDDFSVVGRATPQAKLRIVRALRDKGYFVAVTGDGVNDAPALQAANIGLAMGKAGTDVAREASDLVITDDNFASIVAGVEEGRVAYDNVRKVIYLLVSTGLGEVLAVMLAMISGMPVPFRPAQLLWLNLVTNGIQDVALAFEPKEAGVLDRKPRPEKEGIFNQIMIERTVLAAMVFGLVSFAMFRWLMQNGYTLDESRGMVLNLFVVFEVMHLGNSRSESRSMFLISPFSNRLLLLGTLGAITLHLIALNLPVTQTLLGTTMPSLRMWGILILLATSIVVVMETHKLYRYLKPLA